MEFALNAPYSSYVIVSTSEETIPLMTPLNRSNHVVIIVALWVYVVILRYINVPQLHLGLEHIALVKVPDVHEEVACTTGGKHFLVRIPFRVKYLA